MSGNTALVQVQGETVTALRLQGKDYVPVHVRIESAHRNGAEAKIGYEMVSHEFLTVRDKDVVRICIAIQGKKFFGSAQIMWGGKGADATNPIENAETSALGRALGAAGFDIQNGIASNEEMQRALQARNVRVVESRPTPLPTSAKEPEPAFLPPAGKTWPVWIADLAREAGIFDNKEQVQDFMTEIAGKDPRNVKYSALDYASVAHKLQEIIWSQQEIADAEGSGSVEPLSENGPFSEDGNAVQAGA